MSIPTRLRLSYNLMYLMHSIRAECKKHTGVAPITWTALMGSLHRVWEDLKLEKSELLYFTFTYPYTAICHPQDASPCGLPPLSSRTCPVQVYPFLCLQTAHIHLYRQLRPLLGSHRVCDVLLRMTARLAYDVHTGRVGRGWVCTVKAVQISWILFQASSFSFAALFLCIKDLS